MLVFTPIGGRISSAVIARIIQGIGVGRSSFSVPIFGIEMTTKELRGMMLPGFIQWPL
jgi:SP family sugar:H+ symporter-like MFS transporter